MTQSDFSSKLLPNWLPLYRVEQVLTNSNYIIRKVGTKYTQFVHRICVRPVVPQYQVDDLPQSDPDKFQRDPMLGRFRGELAIFDESIPILLLPPSEEPCVVQNEEKLPPVTVSLFSYCTSCYSGRTSSRAGSSTPTSCRSGSSNSRTASPGRVDGTTISACAISS